MNVITSHANANFDLIYLFIYVFIQGSTFIINYSVFQSGPVSPKVGKQHANVYITYTINDKVNKISLKLT